MNSIGVDHARLLTEKTATATVLQFPSVRKSRGRERLFVRGEVLGDFLAALVATVIAYELYHALGLGRQVSYATFDVLAVGCAIGGLMVLLLDRDGAYRRATSMLHVRETERVLRNSAIGWLLALPVTYFVGHLFPRWVCGLAFFCVPVLLIAEKQCFYFVVRRLHERGYGIRKVVIYGAGETGRRVFSALTRSPKLGLEPVALVDDDAAKTGERVFAFAYTRRRWLPVTRGPVTREVLQELGADVLIAAIPTLARERFAALVEQAERARCSVAFVPNRQLPEAAVHYSDLDGIMLASLREPARGHCDAFKRVLDLAGAVLLLLLFAPLMLAIAVLIRLDSGGPVLFVQKRVGQDGRLFDLYKFRTMHTDAPAYHRSPTDAADPRITRAGRWLRRTSLDELPQLLNVIRGDMSLVGPRPEMPFIVERYTARERQRLAVKPGITGLWQLSADRAYMIHENLQYDLYYIRHRNFFMDVAILLHTLFFAMRGV